MELICIQCGGDFEGRPNRLYCCSRCAKRAEYLRDRIAALQLRAAYTRRQIEIARLANQSVQLHAHRLLVIERELQALTETPRQTTLTSLP